MRLHQLEILPTDVEPPLDVDDVNRRLETASITEILAWARETFGDGLVMATGFGPSGVVLVHYIAQLKADLPVFYIDTGLLFPSTHRLRDSLSRRFGLTFQPISGISLEQQAAHHGERLWSRDPDRCCHIRKVAPLRQYLEGKSAWITGLRRDQSTGRAGTQILEWDEVNGLFKVNPMAAWTSDEVWNHIRAHRLPYNDLHDVGYPSIGCEPCTRKVAAGEHERAGRWAGTTKTECGIHQRREVA